MNIYIFFFVFFYIFLHHTCYSCNYCGSHLSPVGRRHVLELSIGNYQRGFDKILDDNVCEYQQDGQGYLTIIYPCNKGINFGGSLVQLYCCSDIDNIHRITYCDEDYFHADGFWSLSKNCEVCMFGSTIFRNYTFCDGD